MSKEPHEPEKKRRVTPYTFKEEQNAVIRAFVIGSSPGEEIVAWTGSMAALLRYDSDEGEKSDERSANFVGD